MKSSLRQLSFLLLIPVVFVLLPLASVYAATTGSTPTTPPAVTGSTPTTPPSSVGGTIGSITLANPLKVDSIEKLLQLILDIILIFATPIIVFFIIRGAAFKPFSEEDIDAADPKEDREEDLPPNIELDGDKSSHEDE